MAYVNNVDKIVEIGLIYLVEMPFSLIITVLVFMFLVFAGPDEMLGHIIVLLMACVSNAGPLAF